VDVELHRPHFFIDDVKPLLCDFLRIEARYVCFDGLVDLISDVSVCEIFGDDVVETITLPVSL
jgi:hypothetical protein